MSNEKQTIKGIPETQYENAKSVIMQGFENKQDPDEIKTKMFEQGIPFSNLVRLYRAITISEGLVISPAEIRENISEYLDENLELAEDLTQEDLSFEGFKPIIAEAVKNITGATEKKVIAQIRKRLEDMDLAMPTRPKKSKGGPKGSKINKTIVDLFFSKPDATSDEFTDAIAEVTTKKSAKKWIRLYPVFSSLATGKSADMGLAPK